MSEKGEKTQVALDEEKVLNFWEENDTFQKSLEKDSPKGEYVFYDGPPFATGLPHHGHILASAIKDAVPRYQTMRGYHVERLWGWDTHGLPIENIVEKKLGISGKKDIEKVGVEEFNRTARSQVLEFVSEWKKTVERIGRWVDFDNSYKTMDNSYIESVWWALSEVNKKGLLYEGFKVLPYCSRCETPVANSEIAMDNSYKEIPDLSVTVKLELVDEPGTYLLAWTTTPWTLPANSAAAVNTDIDYVRVKITGKEDDDNGNDFILAKERLNIFDTANKQYVIMKEMKGKDLVGLKYNPPFDYFKDAKVLNIENGWKVYAADYVTTEAGTGLVHLAPAYGEEDMELAKKYDIPFFLHVESNGTFKKEVTDFAGQPVKPKEEHMQTDIEIIKWLAHNGKLFAKEKIRHSYPHCFRCETPLYYSALSAWFINIQEVKAKLLKLNKDIHWVPDHLKEGRFHKSMEGAPDWNISRNRYWASPLPFWKSEDGDLELISSIEDIRRHTVGRNTYTLMRHGEAYSNVKGVASVFVDSEDHLTEEGKEQVEKQCKALKKQNFDLVFASDFVRTRETLEILKEHLGLSDDQIVFDERLREVNLKSFEGKTWKEHHDHYGDAEKYFTESRDGDETYYEVKERAGEFLYEVDEKYEGKNILVISHHLVLMLMHAVREGHDLEQTVEAYKSKEFAYKNAEVRKLEFGWLPHNERYEMDLHRPYIDQLVFEKGGKEYRRIPEVVDCWVESGSMPFAQKHYPFENIKEFKKAFPAQFVAEYIAQTRTWFYYTHAMSTILFNSHPFENIVTTGNILAEDGSKMSKSKGNFPDPWLVFDKYGVDAERFYLLSSPLLKSEDLNFSEKGLDEVYKKIVLRLKNVVSFYEMYKSDGDGCRPKSKNVLDTWMLSRLDQVHSLVTTGMEEYELDRASRPLLDLVDDLSTWYVRRSRDRFKGEEKEEAVATLQYVLLETAKLLAPFTPFIAEEVYQKVSGYDFGEGDKSVHLLEWSKESKVDTGVLETMDLVREVVTKALEARDAISMKVRQPLATLKVKGEKFGEEFVEIVKDEVNVKDVVFDNDIEGDVWLDANLTPELKAEGMSRELVRHIQSVRKKMSLVPEDRVVVTLDGDVKDVVDEYMEQIHSVTGADSVEFGSVEGESLKLSDDVVVKVEVRKV